MGDYWGNYDDSGNYKPLNNSRGGQGYSSDTNVGAGWDAYSTQIYKPYAGNFANPDDAKNKALLQQYYASLGARRAPTADAANAGSASLSANPYLAPAQTYGGATIDQAQSNEARAYQLGLLKQLQGEAAGTSPSIAEAQMKQGLQQNLQQQASLAGSLGGQGNPALAMRNLQMGAASQNQQLLGQAGIARLQEQQMAQQQLGGVAAGMRGQDIGVAAQQAQLAQQTGLANMAAGNQFSLANAGFEQQNNLANAQMKNQFALQNAGWLQQANLANQQSQLGLMGLTQQGQSWDIGQQLGMSEADRAAAMQYEQLMQSGSIAQNEIGEKAYEAAAGTRAKMVGGVLSGLGGALAQSDERTKSHVRDESYDYGGLTLSPIDEKTDVADETSQMSRTAGGVGDDGPSRGQVALGNFFQGFGSSLAGTSPSFAKYKPTPSAGGASPFLDTEDPEGAAVASGRQSFAQHMAGIQQRNSSMLASGGGGGAGADSSSGMGAMLGKFGGGGGGGDVLSDESEKSDVHHGASGQLLDPLTPYSYQYKDPTKPGAGFGRHLGIMAQDLERSRYGAQAVVETPQGKMVDYGKLAPPMLAAEADMHKRLSVIESMLDIGKGHDEGDTTETPSKKKKGRKVA